MLAAKIQDNFIVSRAYNETGSLVGRMDINIKIISRGRICTHTYSTYVHKNTFKYVYKLYKHF